MFQIFEKAFDSADCTSNIYEWSEISGKEAEISLSSSSPSPSPLAPSKYCSIRLAVKVAIHSFETPRACGCVYFSEDRVEHAPTRVHTLGLTTHARTIRRRNRRHSIIRRSAFAAASDDGMNGEYSPNIRTLRLHAATNKIILLFKEETKLTFACNECFVIIFYVILFIHCKHEKGIVLSALFQFMLCLCYCPLYVILYKMQRYLAK